MRVEITRDELADLLRKAADAHHVYEQERGEPDEQWADWYAAYIVQHLDEID